MSLTIFPDEFLGFLQLKEDLLFDRIPDSKRMDYVSDALEIGQQCAKSTPKTPVSNLFKEKGVELEERPSSGRLFTTKLRAQYEEDNHGQGKVTYYRESILNLAEAAGITYDQALNIHLAHEYFHLLELRDLPVNERLDKVSLPSIFGWKRYGTIMKTSEIAANAFAKQLLRLPMLPNYYDYIYLETTGQIPKTWLEQAYDSFRSQGTTLS